MRIVGAPFPAPVHSAATQGCASGSSRTRARDSPSFARSAQRTPASEATLDFASGSLEMGAYARYRPRRAKDPSTARSATRATLETSTMPPWLAWLWSGRDQPTRLTLLGEGALLRERGLPGHLRSEHLVAEAEDDVA